MSIYNPLHYRRWVHIRTYSTVLFSSPLAINTQLVRMVSMTTMLKRG